MKIHIFYGHQYLTFDGMPKHLGDGAWVKIGNQWYLKDNGALVIQRDKSEIPASVKAQCLLIGEPL